MSARNIYHDNVRRALVKDGWTITHDPLHLKIGRKNLHVDLGAQRVLAAEKREHKIAVEIQSFLGYSDILDLEQALGQFTLYHDVLKVQEPDRVLYLAVPEHVRRDLFEEPIGKVLLQNQRLRLIFFDPKREELLQWIP